MGARVTCPRCGKTVTAHRQFFGNRLRFPAHVRPERAVFCPLGGAPVHGDRAAEAEIQQELPAEVFA